MLAFQFLMVSCFWVVWKKKNLRPTEKKWSAVLLVGASSAGPRQTHFIMDLTPFGPCEGERKMRLTPRERDESVERERGWKKERVPLYLGQPLTWQNGSLRNNSKRTTQLVWLLSRLLYRSSPDEEQQTREFSIKRYFLKKDRGEVHAGWKSMAGNIKKYAKRVYWWLVGRVCRFVWPDMPLLKCLFFHDCVEYNCWAWVGHERKVSLRIDQSDNSSEAGGTQDNSIPFKINLQDKKKKLDCWLRCRNAPEGNVFRMARWV